MSRRIFSFIVRYFGEGIRAEEQEGVSVRKVEEACGIISASEV
jgi:hypothetical protein